MVAKKVKIKKAQYDVIVIGGGPGGYVAAIRCAQLGLKTACVDEWINHEGQASLGGTCLNVGCIPSKALLESSQHYARAKSEFAAHGIKTGRLSLDLATMQARKKQVVSDLTRGVASLFKANKVDEYRGRGKIKAAGEAGQHTVYVKSRTTRQRIAELSAKNVVVATGSSPIRLPQAPLTDNYILDSAAALELEKVPARLGIIGGGAIGLELGSIWQRLGSSVIILEAMQALLPGVDETISRQCARSFKQQGLDIRLNARLVSTEIKNRKVHIHYEVNGRAQVETVDKLVVAVGRKPNSERVLGSEFGVEMDERSYILVKKHCATSVPGVYAIGDVVGGPMLAHKASEEGIMVANHIAGKHGHVDYDLIPAVIYTHPEIAWVGKTEAQCINEGLNYKTGRFPLAANGRARAGGETEGLVKIISDADSDRIIGVHVMAAQASEIIAQAVIA
ncbi:MAG TPA: dihydrolipoyl dehydrogenase, partial [Thiotrichales bacterium]|nr:dihydrolipoyl dehydrogenase [Thiotrichales bacterium]